MFRHSFFDETDDRTVLIANIWYSIPNNPSGLVELNIKTYDVETCSQDEVFIDLRNIYSDDEINKFAFDIEKVRKTAKEFISKCAKVERDSYDIQYKLIVISTKSLKIKDTSYSYNIDGYETEEALSDYETGTSNYDISL